MSIRPSYGKRSVLQVLSDGMSQHPPTGTSCCEDAAQSAAEVDRLTRERDSLQRCVDQWVARGEKAEAERDDLKRQLHDAIEVCGEQYSELQAKLDAAEQRPALDGKVVLEAVKSMADKGMELTTENIVSAALSFAPLASATPRPTLDREAVKTILFRNFQNRPPNFDRAEKELSALAFETANAWQGWMGPKVDPGDFEVIRDSVGNIRVDGEYFSQSKDADDVRERARAQITLRAKAMFEAVARFIESEQAATGDEEQRAKAFFYHLAGPGLVEGAWESLPEKYRAWFTTAVPDDWTPPESEA